MNALCTWTIPNLICLSFKIYCLCYCIVMLYLALFVMTYAAVWLLNCKNIDLGQICMQRGL